eukprot:1068905-Pelagomonas_calceolata.AAC.7
MTFLGYVNSISLKVTQFGAVGGLEAKSQKDQLAAEAGQEANRRGVQQTLAAEARGCLTSARLKCRDVSKTRGAELMSQKCERLRREDVPQMQEAKMRGDCKVAWDSFEELKGKKGCFAFTCSISSTSPIQRGCFESCTRSVQNRVPQKRVVKKAHAEYMSITWRALGGGILPCIV